MSRVCSDCAAPIGRNNRSGRCRSCGMRHKYTSNPEIARERGRMLRHKFANDPEFRERQVRGSQQRLAAWRATEAGRKALAATAAYANEVKSRRLMAWCPDDRRTEYEGLRKSLGSVEAKRIVMADMEPLELQLAKMRDGAALVTKQDYRRADHDFTMGGIATEML